jgi:uncharacterized SAM-binding protein YcdF (DUF218 family)
MFYLVSKVVWFVLTPSNAIVLAAIAGLLLHRLGRQVIGLRLIAGALIALVVTGLTPFANLLILPLEDRFPAFVDDGQPVNGVVVLGGSYETEVTNVRGQMTLNEAGERVIAMAELARRYPQARIIFSGGGSVFSADQTAEADLVAKTLPQLGIEASRVSFERASLNTEQNATLSRQIAQPRPGERWLLVTSAFHMPRSVGAFRAAGFDVVAHPVDYRTAGPSSLLRPFGFISEGLRRTDVATKEWIGLLAYYVSGKTDGLFPAPPAKGGKCCDTQ